MCFASGLAETIALRERERERVPELPELPELPEREQEPQVQPVLAQEPAQHQPVH